MKNSEIDIIKHLRKGKQANISEIARQLQLPISTVRDRIKKIEEKCIIKRSSLIDYGKLGYLTNVMLAIKISPEQKIEFIEFLKSQNCVNSIYHINSGFSFLVEIVCKDTMELIRWMEYTKSKFEIEPITYHILKIEEKEIFVPAKEN